MSDKSLFTFIEGKTHDPYFYDKLCSAVCDQLGVSYEQIAASELPGGIGGKPALLGFYQYVRRRRFLQGTFKGSKKLCVFFLDKDIDDILRKMARSQHVIYTAYYDVENHLFVEGDLHESVAAAASLTRQMVAATLRDPAVWRSTAAHQWKEWVKLCILVRKRGVNCGCNYRLASKVNTPLDGPIDKPALAKEIGAIRTAAGLTNREFLTLFNSVSTAVDRLYSIGRHDVVFKGKWYRILLELHFRKSAGGRQYDANGLGDRVSHALMLTIDYRGGACAHFKIPLMRLIRKTLKTNRAFKNPAKSVRP